MKVNCDRDISFKSLYTNKTLKKGLEFAANNGALFASTAAVGFSVLRPVSIWMTPKTDADNRKLAISKSIASSIIGFLLTLGLSHPLSKSIQKIDNAPEKYLTYEAVKFFKEGQNDIYKSKRYSLGTQLFKLGLGGIVAIPKSILVASSVPYLMSMFQNKNKPAEEIKQTAKEKNISFKAKPADNISKGIASILNKPSYQNFCDKLKDTNFPMHIIALTDTISTIAFAHQIDNSDKIQNNRKKTLIYNSYIATGLSILSGYILDKLLENPTKNFVEKYKKINSNDKNLKKQIEGIKVAKPILILGITYYILIPFISTFLAEKAPKKIQ